MNKEEMQDLLEIGCCIYHDRLCEKAYNYILEMQNKIDKAIDFINEWEKYTKEKRPLEVSMLDLLYIKEILGDKE